MADKTFLQLTQSTTIVAGDLLAMQRTGDPVKSIDYSVLYSNLNTALSGNYLAKASNLGDLASPTAARANLGLGGAAVLNVGTSAGTVAAGDDARFGQVANGSITPAKLSTGGPTWDGAGNVYGTTFSGTFFGNVNGSITGNAATATALTAGNKTISGELTADRYIATGTFPLQWNGTDSGLRKVGSILSLDMSIAAGYRIEWSNATGVWKFVSNGVAVASLDTSGNMIIKGSLTQNGTP